MATIFQRRRTTPSRRRISSRESGRYLNRELSWLDFNERVLALAEDPHQPLLERVKFLAIFATNLDEFFQIRVAGLKRQEAAGLGTISTDGLTAALQLVAIDARVRDLADRHAPPVRRGRAAPIWPRMGSPSPPGGTSPPAAQGELRQAYEDQIFPVLTPLAVDPGHPFPYISNLSLNLAVLVKDKGERRRLFARIKVPLAAPSLPDRADRGRAGSLGPARGGHCRQPRQPVPGDDHRRLLGVPGDPPLRPRDR